jgi:hypothetical protein
MKFVYAQTVIEEEKLRELKRKTGMNTRDSLMEAINHYLSCHLHDFNSLAIEKVDYNLDIIRSIKKNLENL